MERISRRELIHNRARELFFGYDARIDRALTSGEDAEVPRLERLKEVSKKVVLRNPSLPRNTQR